MARIKYFVTLLHKDKGLWSVVLDGEQFGGPYDTQKEAILVAVHAAHIQGQVGRDAQVLVQGEDNKIRTEWTYGDDPYPPPG
ncbi:DUF2188 domain-containing protein [Bradyrhizobium sp. USDA 377]